jgi:alcohol dehydrogenase class IV
MTTSESDDLARNALGRLVPGLLRCKKNRAYHDASLQCQLGSVDAMAACTLISFKLGASHGIGHQVHNALYSCAFFMLMKRSSVLSALVTGKPVAYVFQPCASSMLHTTLTQTARPTCATS